MKVHKSGESQHNLGKKIKLARVQKGMKQYELAEMVGISANYVSLIEAEKKLPSVRNLCKIAEALDLKLGLLLEKDPIVRDIKELAALYDLNGMTEALHRLYIQSIGKTE